MKLTKCTFLAIFLFTLLSLLPVTARAETVVFSDIGQEGSDVNARLDSDGTLTIYGTGAMWDYTFDHYGTFIDGIDEQFWPVTSLVIEEGITYIGDRSFYEAPNLKSVTFPNSLENIGYRAFSSCHKLTSIRFGTGLKSTDIEVFSYCDALTSVTLPNVDVDYGRHFFLGCKNLRTVVIPSVQTTISGNMFEDCRSLTNITLPRNLKSIEGGAFEFCTSLRSITIPNTVTEIGQSAFESCSALTSISIPGSVERIDHRAFEGCSNLTSVTLGEGIREMGQNVFQMCMKLESVTIPSTVTEIVSTFSNATYLKTIRFLGPAPRFNNAAFDYCTATVYYPAEFPGWTEDVLQDYWGDITWVPYHLCYFDGMEPVFNIESNTHTRTCDVCGATKTEACTLSYNILTEATRDNYGSRECTCSVCNGTYQEEYAYRLAGTGRCETALAAAAELKAVLGKEKFDNIIIASGINFADALAGSYLAAKKEAPILLYAPGYAGMLSDYVSDNLSDSGTVYILGGTSAVASDMDTALSGCAVIRLAGADRIGTNLAILNEAGVTEEEILVCTAFNFADSLSASAVGLPILLVGNQLTEAQNAFLSQLNGNNLCIIGGESAVSSQIEAALGHFGTVQRVAGANRSATSVAVAERFFTAPSHALLAYSLKFPDGLCGGPLAYALSAPLLLVTPGYESITGSYVSSSTIDNGLVLGGTAVLTDSSVKLTLSLR